MGTAGGRGAQRPVDELIRLVCSCLTKVGLHVLKADSTQTLPQLRSSMVAVALASWQRRSISADGILANNIGVGTSSGCRVDAELLLEIYSPYLYGNTCAETAEAVMAALAEGIAGWTLGTPRMGESRYDADADCCKCELRVPASAYAYDFVSR